ncbi:DUF1131 family protein [Parvibaculum sp.]|uniref:DUF1131 family protein n=1 Tax=Parvibaculum sp. TaxID=2024848 RepID=UPI00320FF511
MFSTRILSCLVATTAAAFFATAALAVQPLDTYVVGDAGVGPLDNKVPFDQASLAKLLPQGVTFSRKTIELEGAAPYTVLRVSKGKELLFEFESNGDRKKPRLTGITVFTRRIADTRGARVNASLKSLYHYGETPDCIPGAGRYTGRIFCTVPKLDHLIYVFGGKKPAEAGVLPPPAEIANWRLIAIMWSAT